MSLLRIKLRSALAHLRQLRGQDEQSVSGADSPSAIALLDRLLVKAPAGAPSPVAAVLPGEAARLTISDRDQLLAAVLEATFGPRVESTARCSACGAPFDLDFRVDEISEAVRRPAGTSGASPAPGGAFELPNGRRFRLPTGEDEIAVLDLPEEHAKAELLRRCVLEGAADPTSDLLAAMEAEGGVIDLDVGARCPECGHEDAVRFAVQAYLLQALLQERDELRREVHRLATAYGWSHRVILSLPRSERRTLVRLVETEASRPRSTHAEGRWTS